ncbi:MAG: glucose-6-phosphate dehydrogenase, partial [Candidatus Sumerlaeota bacterium]|nr:glucose-6-phosphate dehydrogenase [Candidatus Sumerlaeota bacterium]
MPTQPRTSSGSRILAARTPDPCVMVLFGASGDLAHRKIAPALYNLALDKALPEEFALIGFSRSVPPPQAYRETLRATVEKFSRRTPLDNEAWNRFAARIDTFAGDPADAASVRGLRQKIEEMERGRSVPPNRLFYLATPPAVFPPAIRNVKDAGLIHPVQPEAPRPRSAAQAPPAWSRIIIEKPYGRDLESAHALNRVVAEAFDESQVYRIDHYLGKETVQNILVFRFGNAIFEPLWNRRHIHHVQVTAAEDIGIEGRGAFYESTGIVRDILQNHMIQLLNLVAIEPPVSFGADDVRDAKLLTLRSLRPLYDEDVKTSVVLGQYRGYREETGVAADSRTPTYVAARVMIDNWRWQGIPFYLRAGKHLTARRT